MLSQPLRGSSIEVKTERAQLGMTNHKRSATLIIAGTRLDKRLAGTLGTVVRPPFPASGSSQHAHLDVDLSSIGRGHGHTQDRNSVLADTLRTRLAHLLPPVAPPRRLPSRDRLSIPLQATSNLILAFCFRVFFRSQRRMPIYQVQR
ncbi:hypothetical protein E8E01_19070 [Methylorubrum populi]|uniref:hypothetical protein n=1 Tax=Methylorubrum populi TaxID=223967 RepID=UPI001150634F|nr:hypothetical protein [Methylorubrum populi]QDI82373.1 hypothetical protein E8E01_19070 [Methylorubrum populi]